VMTELTFSSFLLPVDLGVNLLHTRMSEYIVSCTSRGALKTLVHRKYTHHFQPILNQWSVLWLRGTLLAP
jgi:hypothetical protein